MLSILDFRNGRYQGEIVNGKPHGAGIFLHISFTFVIAQWNQGEIKGLAMIVNNNGNIFCGEISQSKPFGLCLYELQHDHVKLMTFVEKQGSPKIAAVVPHFKLILEIEAGLDQAKVVSQEPYSTSDLNLNREILSKILGIPPSANNRLKMFQSCYHFFRQCFVQRYSHLFQHFILTLNGYKQFWMGFKQAGLGIRLQPLQNDANRCRIDRAYLVRQMGVMTKQNLLIGLGFKTMNDTMKGVLIQQGIYGLPHTLVTYQLTEARPNKCALTFSNHLKRSLFFIDKYLEVSVIYKLSMFVGLFDRHIFDQQRYKIAQFVIQNPNEDKLVLQQILKKRKQKTQQRQVLERQLLNKTEIDGKIQDRKKIMQTSLNLNLVKEEIYRSVSKKNGNKNNSFVNYRDLEVKHPHPDRPPFATVQLIDISNPKSKTINQKNKNNDQVENNRQTGRITPRKNTPVKSPGKTKNTSYQKSKDKSKRITAEATIIEQTPLKPKTQLTPILKTSSKKSISPSRKSKSKVIFRQEATEILPKYNTSNKNTSISMIGKGVKGQSKPYESMSESISMSPKKGQRRRLLTQNPFAI